VVPQVTHLRVTKEVEDLKVLPIQVQKVLRVQQLKVQVVLVVLKDH